MHRVIVHRCVAHPPIVHGCIVHRCVMHRPVVHSLVPLNLSKRRITDCDVLSILEERHGFGVVGGERRSGGGVV